MVNNQQINVIVCVYNEGKTIESVIKSLLNIPFIDKLFIVNDGSTDNISEIVKGYENHITYIESKVNKGKGHSVATALDKIDQGIIIILDADILNYNEDNILELCSPVTSGEAKFTLGTTKEYTFRKPGKMAQLLGQRCYRFEDLIPFLEEIRSSSKYGLEIVLNERIPWINHKMVFLKGTKHLIKTQKYSLIKAIKGYLYEAISIFQEYLK